MHAADLGNIQQRRRQWVATPDDKVRKPNIDLTRRLKALFLARDDQSLFVALGACNCLSEGSIDLEALRCLVSKHVLVLRGSVAQQYWCTQVAAGHMPRYRQVACFGRCTFAIHGTCEHVHAAWLHSGDICMAISKGAVFRGKKFCRRAALPAIIQPARKRQRRKSSQPLPRSASSDGLKALLSDLGFQEFWPLFAKEQVNLSLLASWDLTSMKAYFPAVAGGPASQILLACKQQVAF